MEQIETYVGLYEELFGLVEIEKESPLTQEQKDRYLLIVEVLYENNLEIPFGVEI